MLNQKILDFKKYSRKTVPQLQSNICFCFHNFSLYIRFNLKRQELIKIKQKCGHTQIVWLAQVAMVCYQMNNKCILEMFYPLIKSSFQFFGAQFIIGVVQRAHSNSVPNLCHLQICSLFHFKSNQVLQLLCHITFSKILSFSQGKGCLLRLDTARHDRNFQHCSF